MRPGPPTCSARRNTSHRRKGRTRSSAVEHKAKVWAEPAVEGGLQEHEAELAEAESAGRKLPARRWDEFCPMVSFSKELLKQDPNDEEAGDQPLYVEYTRPAEMAAA